MASKQNNRKRRGIIEAAGGLLWREDNQRWRIALVHRAQYDDWTLPKGWRESGETWKSAAAREVREETYCSVRVKEFAGCNSYTIGRVPKVILYWHMELKKEGQFRANKETDMLLWATKHEALERLSYESERQLVDRAWQDRTGKKLKVGN